DFAWRDVLQDQWFEYAGAGAHITPEFRSYARLFNEPLDREAFVKADDAQTARILDLGDDNGSGGTKLEVVLDHPYRVPVQHGIPVKHQEWLALQEVAHITYSTRCTEDRLFARVANTDSVPATIPEIGEDHFRRMMQVDDDIGNARALQTLDRPCEN